MTYLHTSLSLGLLLQSEDVTIKRNAMSILKVLQRCDHKTEHGQCIYCFKPSRTTPLDCPYCGREKSFVNGHCASDDCPSRDIH